MAKILGMLGDVAIDDVIARDVSSPLGRGLSMMSVLGGAGRSRSSDERSAMGERAASMGGGDWRGKT